MHEYEVHIEVSTLIRVKAETFIEATNEALKLFPGRVLDYKTYAIGEINVNK